MFHYQFACPACTTALESRDVHLFCNSCHRQFPARDGIYSFLSGDGAYTDAADNIMDSIIVKMADTDWKQLVYDAFAYENPWLYQIITDHTRTDYLYLHQFQPNDVVLDIGSGWGQSVFAMAKRVQTVIALENNYKRVKFIQHRARQEKAKHVIPVHADVLQMPFHDSSFDFISMIGVLEWVALDKVDKDPRKIQIQSLKRVYDALKVGGTVCIGIENSHALEYTFGKPDDHTGIENISYLSRDEANKLSQKTNGQDYRTYTYTKDGYSALLEEAGFKKKNISYYYPIISYKEPTFIVPLSSQKVLQYYHTHLDAHKAEGSLQERVKRAEMEKISQNDYENEVSSYFIFVKK